MTISPLRGASRNGFAEALPAAPLDIRHLVFDTGDAHDLTCNGLYRVARQLTAEQVAAGERARMIFLRAPSRLMPGETQHVPVQVLDLAGRTWLGRRVTLASDLLDAITAPSGLPVFFHIHAAREPMLVALATRLRRLGIPYAVTVHGRYSHLAERGARRMPHLSSLYLRTLERRVLEAARFVQGVSAAECALIRRIAPGARVELVPNAAYSRRLEGPPPPPARRPRPPGAPLFGFLGRYEIRHKGLDLLLAGFAIYRSRGGKGRLEMVGTGPSRARIEAHARQLGVAELLSVEGPRFGAEKRCTLETWDYFVMPSRFEGVPIGALEAGLAGLPLIVTDETGLREEVARAGAGIGIAALTPQAVADALHTAEHRPAQAWSRMSDAAYRMAVSIGDWTTIAAKLATLYRRG